jgi:hypothetical protein
MSSFPHWLELSGLPRLLQEQTRGSAGWLILRTLIDLDCSTNSKPGTIELTVLQLADRAGLDGPATRRALKQLQKGKWAQMFLPEHDEETALYKIASPLRTPASHADILAQHPTASTHRYCDCLENGDDVPLPAVQATVDLYFNTCGLKMNAFIVDRLHIITAAVPQEQLKRIFYRAQKAGVRSLSTIERWCLDYRKAQEKKPEEPAA